MLDWLKDVIRPVRTQHPFFGKLRYLRAARCWEGKLWFAPIGREVEVLIMGEATVPTEKQRRFVCNAAERYAAIWPAVRERLVVEAARIRAGAITEFVLVGVEVPELGEETSEWALSCETRPPSWHFTVSMQGWSPGDVLAEC